MIPPPMTPAPKTTEVARLYHIPVYALHNYVRYGLIPPPRRDGSGHYVWSDKDIAAAREAWELRRPLRRESAA